MTNQDLVLYNIARARKQVIISEIQSLTGNILDRRQILQALDNLKKRGLILKKEEGIILNVKQFNIRYFDKEKNEYFKLNRIKSILGENWETNWEDEWIEISKNNNQQRSPSRITSIDD
ncbi:MAG: hypothetical protein PHF86_12545 [Candidatus Nanoarchaeia archaeon]|nr:hypothetical protein [Candidatus Nanoarchaeia archaeon]